MPTSEQLVQAAQAASGAIGRQRPRRQDLSGATPQGTITGRGGNVQQLGRAARGRMAETPAPVAPAPPPRPAWQQLREAGVRGTGSAAGNRERLANLPTGSGDPSIFTSVSAGEPLARPKPLPGFRMDAGAPTGVPFIEGDDGMNLDNAPLEVQARLRDLAAGARPRGIMPAPPTVEAGPAAGVEGALRDQLNAGGALPGFKPGGGVTPPAVSTELPALAQLGGPAAATKPEMAPGRGGYASLARLPALANRKREQMAGLG